MPIVGFAQSERDSITGVVIDTSRAPIPAVSVKVINAGTNATTTVVSSKTGSYSAASGFQSANVDGIRLTAGATARVDITLNLGRCPSRWTSSPTPFQLEFVWPDHQPGNNARQMQLGLKLYW